MVSWKDGEPEFKIGFKREHSKGMDEKQYATKLPLSLCHQRNANTWPDRNTP